MKNAFIDLLKIIARADPKSLLVRVVTIILNSTIPPVTTFLLGKTVLSLTNANLEKTILLSVCYIIVVFLWNFFLRYSGVVNARLNDRLVIKLREHMIDLHQTIPQDIVESSDFIQLRKRGNDFLTTYALRFFGSAERLVTIILTLLNYCIIFCGIHPLFILIVLCASLPGLLCRAKFVPEMRRMYEELQEDRNYQGYYKKMLTNPSALKELRVWGLEKPFYASYQELTAKIHRRQTNHYYRHGFVGGGVESLAFGAGVIGSILLGIRLTASGIILIDGFVMVVSSILDVQDTFISAYYNILGYRESSYYAKDYLQIYHMANDSERGSRTASVSLGATESSERKFPISAWRKDGIGGRQRRHRMWGEDCRCRGEWKRENDFLQNPSRFIPAQRRKGGIPQRTCSFSDVPGFLQISPEREGQHSSGECIA